MSSCLQYLWRIFYEGDLKRIQNKFVDALIGVLVELQSYRLRGSVKKYGALPHIKPNDSETEEGVRMCVEVATTAWSVQPVPASSLVRPDPLFDLNQKLTTAP